MITKIKCAIVIIFITISVFTLLVLPGCGSDDNPSEPTDEGTGESKGIFTDSRDNQTYDWVQIGEQIWMAENLSYKPTSDNYWSVDNDTNNIPIYGYLYDWEIAQTIAPAGWHLPSQSEWQSLVDNLGGTDIAYNKLLEAGTLHWRTPNNATNESGFTALPTGYFDQRDNSFNASDFLTMFHSTTEYSGSNTSAMGLILNQNFMRAGIEGRPKLLALPIRCIKD